MKATLLLQQLCVLYSNNENQHDHDWEYKFGEKKRMLICFYNISKKTVREIHTITFPDAGSSKIHPFRKKRCGRPLNKE